ncbi:MAG: RES domain-containing protein [Rhizobiaceae bacterium]|nr:RES domain-containing protein [Rhizobiaceae bacterium]
MQFAGKLYRALNPIYAREPLSGRGAQLYGGRFNPKGMAALYLSLSPLAALREANQVGSLQPTTLVSYNADIAKLFDCRAESELARFGMSGAGLADASWREQMRRQGEARTQTFARELVGAGFSGLLVRSFAVGATDDDLNIVLWRWGDSPPALLTLIDDEGRLSR